MNVEVKRGLSAVLLAALFSVLASGEKTASLEQAQVLMEEGKSAEAVPILREYIHQNPRDYRGYVLLGRSYAETSQVEKAVEVLRQAVALAPSSTEAHLDLGVVEVELGHNEAGKKEFRRVLEIDPKQKEALFNLGKVLFNEEDYVPAQKMFTKYMALSPSDTDALIYLLRCGIKNRDAETVANAQQELRRLVPNDGKLHAQIGRWLAEGRYFEAAQEEFATALGLSPNSHELRGPHSYDNGAMSLDRGQPQKAIDLLSRLPDSEKNKAQYHYLMGRCYEQLLDTVNAYVEYRTATEIDPDQEDYYLTLASLLLSQGITSPTDRVLDAALQRFPKSARVQVAMGLLELVTGNAEFAMVHYRKAAELAPNTPQVYKLLGRIELKQGHYKGAIEAFKKAALLNPADAQPHFFSGLAYMKLEQGSDQALHSFLASLKLDPELPETYFWIGTIYARREHEYRLAAKYLEECLKRAPSWAAPYQLLIQSYRLLGDNTRAEEEVSRYKESARKVRPQSDLRTFLDKDQAAGADNPAVRR